MKKLVLICFAVTVLLFCSCGTTDMYVAAPLPGVGSVVVSSNPVVSRVGVVTPGATVVYSTYPRTYVTYPYGYSGYYYYSTPPHRRRTTTPPPPRKRRRY